MKLFFSFSCLLACLTCISQQNPFPAYLVTQNGDSLRGSIGYDGWTKNPQLIQFTSLEGISKTYLPAELKFVGLDGFARYRSAMVNISKRPLDTTLLRKYTGVDSAGETLLLKELVSGSWSLYKYLDIKEHYFLQVNNGPIVELGFELVPDEYNTEYNLQAIYRDQLNAALRTTNAELPLYERIKKLKYDESELISFFDLVNGVNTGKIKRRDYEKLIRVSYFAGLGVAYNHMTASGAGDASISSVDYIGKLRPGAQFGFDFSSTRKMQHMIIRLELGYYKYLQMGTGEVEASPTERPRKTRYQVLMISVKPGLHALYKIYDRPGFGVYVGAGYVLNINAKSRNRMRHDYLDDGSGDLWEPYRPFKGIWSQGVARAGVFIGKRFEVGLSLPFAGSFLKVDGLKVNPGNNALLVNYRF